MRRLTRTNQNRGFLKPKEMEVNGDVFSDHETDEKWSYIKKRTKSGSCKLFSIPAATVHLQLVYRLLQVVHISSYNKQT